MRPVAALTVAALLAAATHPAHAGSGATDDALPPEPAMTSYRATTLTIDAVSFGFFLIGAAAEGPDGQDTDASGMFMAAGLLGLSFATPIYHASRGHGMRGFGSYLLRGGLASVGLMVAVSARSGCDGWFCELDYIGYGVVGGLAVAALFDAALLTNEPVEARTWTPVVTPTSVGIAATF